MKNFMVVALVLSALSAFAVSASEDLEMCTLDNAVWIIEQGVMEHAANNCREDGEQLGTLVDAMAVFRTIVQSSDCWGKFTPKVNQYLECEIRVNAYSCATEGWPSISYSVNSIVDGVDCIDLAGVRSGNH